ncbi:MAG: Gfo/Idh/MocA family oxidoreductase [Calditrichaeota bacterium]|nr:Gfo/Idh/MocA family oxidoreductase [Calditrichota bacterium]
MDNFKNFALIGAAGYIAPRHMQAIKETGNNLVCAIDKSDSVGILDRYFRNVDFFTEFERFDRHIEMKLLKNEPDRIQYVSICSPNYLHDAHIRFALRVNAHAICEKPLVLNPWNLDALSALEERSETKIYNILQLREHESIKNLREKLKHEKKDTKHSVVLTYVTTRGKWYDYSWKGSVEKSGGVATNIGIHFFDMLLWLFGDVQYQEVHITEKRKIAGFLELEQANVTWYLSLDEHDLPADVLQKGQNTYRSITIDNNEIEFSGGFSDLHTISYSNILLEKGFGIADARASIELVHKIRSSKIKDNSSLAKHPFLA